MTLEKALLIELIVLWIIISVSVIHHFRTQIGNFLKKIWNDLDAKKIRIKLLQLNWRNYLTSEETSDETLWRLYAGYTADNPIKEKEFLTLFFNRKNLSKDLVISIISYCNAEKIYNLFEYYSKKMNKQMIDEIMDYFINESKKDFGKPNIRDRAGMIMTWILTAKNITPYIFDRVYNILKTYYKNSVFQNEPLSKYCDRIKNTYYKDVDFSFVEEYETLSGIMEN